MQNVSTLLTAKASGARDAADQLFELLYGELRSIASAQLHRNDYRGLIHTTTLVHESYLRLLKSGEVRAEDEGQFLAYASHVMRSVIVDTARRHMASKRGGNKPDLTLDTDIADSLTASDEQIIKLHEALEELMVLEPRLAQVVEMRYFGGLQEEEIAGAMAVSIRTVQRDWEKARMLLAVALKAQ
ncbi:MAG TPA: ECF-type sigma factor [Steroidobacteraceae bacterium]|jgi:RNA polymerase sigma factor (TIGR02999 family)|nr:ECF-type sigma factor [Steroidobacteraceae bacterium]